MKPNRTITSNIYNYENISIQLIAKLIEARDNSVEHKERLLEAEDYQCKLYDLIGTIQLDDYNIYIDGKRISNNSDIKITLMEDD